MPLCVSEPDADDEGRLLATSAWARQDNSLSHGLFFQLKERFQCLFDGGAKCKKEDPRANKGGNAIKGIHSNWVGTSIVAAARPQQSIIEREGTLEDMISKNVKGIVNLQEIGEHAACGSGILEVSGFSYDPEYFMRAGIAVYNFPGVDMKSPRVESTLNAVQVIDFHLKRNEAVLVHCHAGLGRTGTTIASYYVFSEGLDPDDAIRRVRECRPGALQTKAQANFVRSFSRFLDKQYKSFPLRGIRVEVDRVVEATKRRGSLLLLLDDKGRDQSDDIKSEIESLEDRYTRAGGPDYETMAAHVDFELALGSQERLLHGSDRKRHPCVPWRLAEALDQIRRRDGEASIASESARIVSGLSNPEKRKISINVLKMELDFHCSRWQAGESVSLYEVLALLDEWLVSFRTKFGSLHSKTKALASVSLSESVGGRSKRALLDSYPKHHALTLYSLGIVALLLTSSSGEGGRLETREGGEGKVVLDWMAGRLVFGKHKVIDQSDRDKVEAMSALLLNLSTHMGERLPPERTESEAVYNM